jgi:hypothetical protein
MKKVTNPNQPQPQPQPKALPAWVSELNPPPQPTAPPKPKAPFKVTYFKSPDVKLRKFLMVIDVETSELDKVAEAIKEMPWRILSATDVEMDPTSRWATIPFAYYQAALCGLVIEEIDCALGLRLVKGVAAFDKAAIDDIRKKGKKSPTSWE